MDTDFVVSDGFIANADMRPPDHKPGFLYLVEPLCTSTSVRKFTGTMSQAKATDKAGATITAFVHWVMADTACNLCFADIQGL
jgi:Alpha-kinase family